MSSDPNGFEPEVFDNNTPVLLWICAAVIIAILTNITMSGAAAHPAVLVLFLMIVLGLAAIVFRIPRVRVEISAAGVSVRERWPLGRRDRQFAAKDVSVSGIAAAQG